MWHASVLFFSVVCLCVCVWHIARTHVDTPPTTTNVVVAMIDFWNLAVEGNVSVAAYIFAYAIALDALTAVPSTLTLDLPTSLRTTSLVLCVLASSPPMKHGLLLEQRGLAVLLLAIAGMVGNHSGEVAARTSDAVYTLLACWSIVAMLTLSNPVVTIRDNGHGPAANSKPTNNNNSSERVRESLISLCGSFVFYAGIRIVRAGIWHAHEAAHFLTSHDDITVRGVSTCSDVVAVSLAFGGTLCVCAGVSVFLFYEQVLSEGSSVLSPLLSMLSAAAFAAAFVAQLATHASASTLPILFESEQCAVAVPDCEAAFRARRFHVSNSATSTLWACTIGLLVFSFPRSRRCANRHDFFSPIFKFATRSSKWVSLLVVLVCFTSAVAFAASDDPEVAFTAQFELAALLLLLASIPICWFRFSTTACLCHAAGLVIYFTHRFSLFNDFHMLYFTHWCARTACAQHASHRPYRVLIVLFPLHRCMLFTLGCVLLLFLTTATSTLLYNNFYYPGCSKSDKTHHSPWCVHCCRS